MTVPFVGSPIENVYKINADGTVTILKSGFYAFSYGIHGSITPDGFIYAYLSGLDRTPNGSISNPGSVAAQIMTTGSIIEFVSAGTVVGLHAYTTGQGQLHGTGNSKSTYLEIINI